MSKGAPNKMNRSAITVKDVKDMAESQGYRPIPSRGITKETAEALGVVTGANPETGFKVHYIPVTKKSKITGYIAVEPDAPKKQGRFKAVGDVDVTNDLIGQSLLEQKSDKRKLFIVEGMWDWMVAFQVLREGKYNYLKKKGKSVNLESIDAPVVTFPLGIGQPDEDGNCNARKALGNNIEFIQGYDEVITCFDNDFKSKKNVGQDAIARCATLLKDFKNTVPKENDIYDVFAKEGNKGVWSLLVFEPKTYELGSVTTSVTDEEFEELFKPIEHGPTVASLPKLMSKIKGFRPGEVTIVLAPPKAGKTTLCKHINYSMAEQGYKTFGIYLEEKTKKARQSMMCLKAGVKLPEFRRHPDIIPKKERLELKELLNSGRIFLWDNEEGSMTADRLIGTMEWAAIKGAEYIVLDHLSKIMSSDKRNNERKIIDNVLDDIVAFSTRANVHIIVVVHTKQRKKVEPPKDMNGNTKYPHWEEVSSTDGRGSAAFEQLCDNMIAIEPERIGNDERGRSRLKVLFNREWDYTGVADYFTINPQTGRIETTEKY